MPFKPGQSGNPSGRPARAVEDQRQSLLAEIFDAKAEREVILAQIRLAKNSRAKGSTTAAKWLFDRKYGPVREIEPSAPPEVVVRVVYEGELDAGDDADD